jgi:beta-lactam-binding protein with PASTA domain
MPNLIGYSFLEAMAELSNHGLNLGKLSYTSDIATNNVLQQKYNGRDIKPGSQIVSGSDIDLVLGLSREDSRTTVPKVVGMKYIRAVDAIHERYLNVGRVHFDPEIKTYRDSVNAYVYKQDAAGTKKTLGSAINLYLTLDESKLPEK